MSSKAKKQKKIKVTGLDPAIPHRLTEGFFVLILALSVCLLLSLASFKGISNGNWVELIVQPNAIGKVGAIVSSSFFFLFGYVAYMFPVALVYATAVLLQHNKDIKDQLQVLALKLLGTLILIISLCGLSTLTDFHFSQHLPKSAGGALGLQVAQFLYRHLAMIGSSVLLMGLTLVGITLMTQVTWLEITESIGKIVFNTTLQVIKLIKQSVMCLLKALFELKQFLVNLKSKKQTNKPQVSKPQSYFKSQKIKKQTKEIKQPEVEDDFDEFFGSPPPKQVKPVKVKVSERYQKSQQQPLFNPKGDGKLPTLSLLSLPKDKSSKQFSHSDLEEQSRNVEQKLLDFGVEVNVVAVHPGPVITRYELQLAPGLKVSKITALGKDLARSLSVISVRVVEVIPGKSVVGLELPNEQRDMVCLSEVLATEVYDKAKSPLTLALGVDIAGAPVIVDLAKMPHLLVAGTTGSGKSVGINAMLLSLIFKSSPDDVRLILVDPKMLELSVYDGIPHLLTPVVTDMKDAASALRWSVMEMERRYRLMAAMGVRNLAGFNKKVSQALEKGEPFKDPLWQGLEHENAPTLTKLPSIVVVIDELADMMMVVGKKVEQLIARIAQKARAAGIHLVLATQRPSVDVLTGLIKSNIPTRIAFQVSSKIDSRTILDQQGADQLLGHGDMLYLAPGSGAPNRVHGAFVDDNEVHRVADAWRELGKPDYIEEIIQVNIDNDDLNLVGISGEENQSDADPLYDEAVAFITQSQKASTSSVQRRFKIGYNRAARLIDEMEKTGVVGPLQGSSREVLAPPPPPQTGE